MMTAQRFLWASAGAVLVCAGVANADLIYVDFSSDGQGVSGNVGMTYNPIDLEGNLAPLMLFGYFGVDPSLPFDPFAKEIGPGMINIGNKGAGIAGDNGQGSVDISGLAEFQNEQLVIDFDTAVFRDDLVLGLRNYKPGNGYLNKDDPAIFVYLTDGTVRMFDEYDIEAGGGNTGTLDLSILLDVGDMVARIGLRETNEHYVLNSIQFDPIPTPGALALLGLGALAQRRRRRSA